MVQAVEEYLKNQKKQNLPDIRPGDTVRVYEKFFDGKKERVQVFEGVVIARKHGEEIGATITVRRVISGIGVEKTFPLHSPSVEKIEIVKRAKVRRAKLYYLRKLLSRKMRLKRKEFKEAVAEEVPEETQETPAEQSQGGQTKEVQEAQENQQKPQSSQETNKQESTSEKEKQEEKSAEVAELGDAHP